MKEFLKRAKRISMKIRPKTDSGLLYGKRSGCPFKEIPSCITAKYKVTVVLKANQVTVKRFCEALEKEYSETSTKIYINVCKHNGLNYKIKTLLKCSASHRDMN